MVLPNRNGSMLAAILFANECDTYIVDLAFGYRKLDAVGHAISSMWVCQRNTKKATASRAPLTVSNVVILLTNSA